MDVDCYRGALWIIRIDVEHIVVHVLIIKKKKRKKGSMFFQTIFLNGKSFL
jgi:general stress protein CsbA